MVAYEDDMVGAAFKFPCFGESYQDKPKTSNLYRQCSVFDWLVPEIFASDRQQRGNPTLRHGTDTTHTRPLEGR